MLIHESYHDLSMQGGVMRVHVFRPAVPSDCPATFGGICVFTEIYQVTGPLMRYCRQLASEGFIVACCESYHEFELPGTALAYTAEDTDKGNRYKCMKSIHGYDVDAAAVVAYLKSRKECNGRIGAVGMCLGGHLAFRCGFHHDVIAAACLFATDIHKSSLGSGGDDTLIQVKSGVFSPNTELLMVWGKQDTHIDKKGRQLIQSVLDDSSVDYAWCEFNAQHAFVRDEASKGRYDPGLAKIVLDMVLELFRRRLTLGLPSLKEFATQTGTAGLEHC